MSPDGQPRVQVKTVDVGVKDVGELVRIGVEVLPGAKVEQVEHGKDVRQRLCGRIADPHRNQPFVQLRSTTQLCPAKPMTHTNPVTRSPVQCQRLRLPSGSHPSTERTAGYQLFLHATAHQPRQQRLESSRR